MTLGFLKDLIPWIAPPVIGAFIGYITNDIAIRMLFRPLKPVRILGIRLPFTPGIFPKERYNLSKSIGVMVSRELITEEAVRRQLHAEKTRSRLASGLSSITTEIFSLPLSRLSGGTENIISSSIEDVVQKALHRFLSSQTAVNAIRDLIGRGAASLSAMKVRDLLDKLDFRSIVADVALPVLAERGARESISSFMGDETANRAGELLTDGLIDGVIDVVAPLADPAVDRLMEWLATADMKAELAMHGRRLLSGVLEKLNVFQRLIFSAGQFERRLEEKMPEIVEDTIITLETVARDPANQRRLLDVLRAGLRGWRSGLAGSGSRPARDRLGVEVARIVSGFLARLGDPAERKKLALDLENRLARSGDRTLDELIRAVPGLSREDAVEKLTGAVIGYVSRKETSDMLSERVMSYAARFLEDNADVPLGTLLGMDAARKERLDGFLFGRLVSLVDSKLPEILSGIDVQELVVKKIDALDVRDVEKLLHGVIASHLRWIDVFGAILGLLIGLIQVALRLAGVS